MQHARPACASDTAIPLSSGAPFKQNARLARLPGHLQGLARQVMSRGRDGCQYSSALLGPHSPSMFKSSSPFATLPTGPRAGANTCSHNAHAQTRRKARLTLSASNCALPMDIALARRARSQRAGPFGELSHSEFAAHVAVPARPGSCLRIPISGETCAFLTFVFLSRRPGVQDSD